MLCMEVYPYSYFWWCGCFQSVLASFVMTDEPSVWVAKIISRIYFSWTHSLLFWFLLCFDCVFLFFGSLLFFSGMAILSKAHKLENFKTDISLKLGFTHIQGLSVSFVGCECLLDTNLDDSSDSGNFSLRGYLPLIQKDSVIHRHGLAVYVKEWFPFTWEFSKTIRILIFLTCSDSFGVFLLFPILMIFFFLVHVSSNID